MDNIGIDRLIEMIDERIGKPVGTIVLYLVVFAIISVAINVSFNYFVKPAALVLERIVTATAMAVTLEEGLRALFGIGVMVVVAVVIFGLGRILMGRSLGRLEKQLDTMIAKVKEQLQQADRLSKKTEADANRAIAIVRKVRQALVERRNLKELAAEIQAIESEYLSANQVEVADTQQPPGTEQETPQ